MTGMTAWARLTRVAKLKPGSTAFVSAASGAVGSIVCQIAKSMDCRVIGSAGKASKIAWLREKAHGDEVFTYKKTESLSAKPGSLAPNGIDVYFDNVGGEHLEAALNQRDQFLKDMSGWIESGAIVWEETIRDGLENAPAAFIGLFQGDNMGKSLVRIS